MAKNLHWGLFCSICQELKILPELLFYASQYFYGANSTKKIVKLFRVNYIQYDDDGQEIPQKATDD